MEKAPFFSIITVTRNAEAELPVTVRSLRAQTFTDYEWIIIDGASTDNTVEIARNCFNPDRDILVSEPDNGVYEAMNKGLRLASGSYVNFLNAGDAYADADALKAVRDTCQGADVIYGDTVFVLRGGMTRYRRVGPIERTISHRMPVCHQSTFTARRLHMVYPFDTSYTVAADYAAIASMFVGGAHMRYVERPLNVDTIRPDAVSIRGRVSAAKEHRRIRTEILRQSLLVAQYRYLKDRAHIAIVKHLQTIPDGLLRRLLPESVRRRIY